MEVVFGRLPHHRVQKGISANQLKRTLGVSYKTAWYLCHRIRAALNEVDAQLLKGIVEADETFVGGKVEGEGRGYKGNKTVSLVPFSAMGTSAFRWSGAGTGKPARLHP